MQEATNTRRVALLLFEGFSNLCLANAVEPLRAANTLARRPLYDWAFLGLTDAPLASSSGLSVQPEAIGRDPGGEILMVMPGYGHEAQATPETLRALRAADRRFDTLAGLDTGSWLLAAAGLLDGHRATSHWDILTDLAETFPQVDVVEARYVIDGSRASCGGATATLELMLDLIEQHHGAALALEVAALFMYGEQEPRLDPARALPPDRTIRAAAAVMRRNVEAPLTIDVLAARVGISQRALERLFRDGTGQSPAQVYRAIRLAEARRRVEGTRASIAEIAQRCGYADATAMTRAFKATFGAPPSALRRSRGFASR